jgi:DNA-directed RNA polymerase specialized sigma24 family protein
MTHFLTVRDRELEALRRHGFGVAYRMLGSVSEAEDVTQEALLCLTRQEGPIDEPAAFDPLLRHSSPPPRRSGTRRH